MRTASTFPNIFAFPPRGNASGSWQTRHFTTVLAWSKTTCRFPQLWQLTRRNLDLGDGTSEAGSILEDRGPHLTISSFLSLTPSRISFRPHLLQVNTSVFFSVVFALFRWIGYFWPP